MADQAFRDAEPEPEDAEDAAIVAAILSRARRQPRAAQVSAAELRDMRRHACERVEQRMAHVEVTLNKLRIAVESLTNRIGDSPHWVNRGPPVEGRPFEPGRRYPPAETGVPGSAPQTEGRTLLRAARPDLDSAESDHLVAAGRSVAAGYQERGKGHGRAPSSVFDPTSPEAEPVPLRSLTVFVTEPG